MTQARSEFTGLINQVNQVLQFIVTGRMEGGRKLRRRAARPAAACH